MENNTKITDTLSERPEIIMIGLLPIVSKPLTYLQIQEIGEKAEKMGEYEVMKGETLSEYTFKNSKAASLLMDSVIISLFRSKINRFIFRRYVKKHLDSKTMKRCVGRIQESFDFAFFFNSTVFLRGMKRKKKEMTETEATAHGHSWEEL